MPDTAKFDIVIIGGGQAGIPLAHVLAEAGRSVALAEREHLGGSCVNFGCTPTKAVIASAKLAHQARHAAEYGLRIPKVEVDFPVVLERAKRILMESREGLYKGFTGPSNPRLFQGHARLEERDGSSFIVRIGETRVMAEQVVLNTGTRTLIPAIKGLEGIDYLHAGNWLDKPALPVHLAIVGGSYIGLEMAQFYRRMGSRVTVIESGAHIASHEDKDVSTTLQEILEAEGIAFRLDTKAVRVEQQSARLILTLEGTGEPELSASHIFVASGRQPNTDDLGLDTVGVKVSDKGIVEADERLATNVDGIWVAGDIRGGPMFTHTAYDDYEVLESQLLGNGSRTTSRIVPYAMFIDPQLARVGMSESEARQQEKQVKVAKYEMEKNGRAREMGEPHGFIKVVVDAETECILGATVLAAEGAEIIHAYIALMNAEAPYTILNRAIHIHPTLSEAVKSAVSDLEV